jgi:hypothetical protein
VGEKIGTGSGSGTGQFGASNGHRSLVWTSPWIRVGTDRFWSVDWGNNRIYSWNFNYTLWGSTSPPAGTSGPQGIAVTGAKRVILFRTPSRVQVTDLWGNSPITFDPPGGREYVEMTAYGSLIYLAGNDNNIYVVDESGTAVATFAKPTEISGQSLDGIHHLEAYGDKLMVVYQYASGTRSVFAVLDKSSGALLFQEDFGTNVISGVVTDGPNVYLYHSASRELTVLVHCSTPVNYATLDSSQVTSAMKTVTEDSRYYVNGKTATWSLRGLFAALFKKAPGAARVDLKLQDNQLPMRGLIYNQAGRLAAVVNKTLTQGDTDFNVDVSEFSSGVYVMVLEIVVDGDTVRADPVRFMVVK